MKALLIFIKNPIEGKVKTRLAADIGDKKALEIYLRLQEHTRKISEESDAKRFLFYSDFTDVNDLWPNNKFIKKLQSQYHDLGRKMYDAYIEVINEGYQKLFIIGSDCYELNSEIISEAYKKLETLAAVIGPANDGGYYGIGINVEYLENKESLLSELFLNKDWSHDQVCNEAMNVLKKHHLECAILPKLNDLDTIEDLKIYPSLIL